ncbi:MAG: YchF/TatD family DNA exonuclease [Candidatus Moranbacteria bacterium]|nr:YchF/TatD family DNA exonuclease [Candidatus Moranbacteria bacterium]
MEKTCPKIIDSHAHLNFYVFKDDKDQIIQEAEKRGAWVINVGSNFETSRKAVEIAQDYSIGIYSAVGVHPIHVQNEEFDEECFRDLAQNNERVIAIGETGLDYYHIYFDNKGISEPQAQKIKEQQKNLFRKHLELSRILNLPLIFHCRDQKENDAYLEMIDILNEFRESHHDFELRGVIHCFSADLGIAKMFLNLGFLIGFTGIITFSKQFDEVIKNLPLDKILVETDCPYLSPEPKRGERNLPQNVFYVAERIAQLKDIGVEKVKQQTVENTRNLFRI